jgi:hypothetical protein
MSRSYERLVGLQKSMFGERQTTVLGDAPAE